MSLYRRLLLGLWTGLLFAQGGLFAPLAFALVPDRVQAGRLAGAGFLVTGYASVVFGLAIAFLGTRRVARQWVDVAWAMAPGFILVLSHLALGPLMDSSRASGPGGTPGADFGTLHGLSSGAYVLATVLAAALWVRDERLAGR